MKKVIVRFDRRMVVVLSAIGLISSSAFGQCAPDVVSPDPVFLPDVSSECFITVPAPSTTDFCDGTVIGTTSDPVTYSTEGAYVINWVFTDAAGNSTPATQNVIIDDVTPPVATTTALSDKLSQCSVNSIVAPTASDNCSGTIVGVTATTFPITAQGTTVVTWTYDDNHGNVISQTQNVVINDNTAPVPNLGTLPNVTSQCEVTGISSPTATDNCNGQIIGTTTTTFPITTQGSTVVIWSYADGNGNVSTQNQTVIIDDLTSPVADVTNLATINGVCSIASLTAPTASDNCVGTVVATTSTTFPIVFQGTTTVIWTYEDGNGNFSSQNQTVILDDNSAPVADVANLPNLTSECAITSLTAPTATDNCAGTITAYHNVPLPITLQGTTVISWTFDDGNGNVLTQTQTAVINDVTAPTPDAAMLSDLTFDCGISTLTAPTATDNCNGFVDVTNNANLPLTVGTYVVTWTYTDASGNISAQTQNITIEDNDGPVVDVATLAPFSVDCELINLTNPIAIDDCGGAVTITHDATLPIAVPGDYVITWTFEDQYGNSTVETQNVTVNQINACLDLVVVNDVITPNGDGKNEYWVVENLSYIADCNVQIFNRWGAQIFETDAYDNLWDGRTVKGELLPEGVYFYIIQCDDEVKFDGYITIVR